MSYYARLYPPVPIIARRLSEDVRLGKLKFPVCYTSNKLCLSFKATKDLVVPAGATVVLGIFKIQRRGELYNCPDRFNPDNFLPEFCQDRHHFAFIPFSSGPRNCV